MVTAVRDLQHFGEADWYWNDLHEIPTDCGPSGDYSTEAVAVVLRLNW